MAHHNEASFELLADAVEGRIGAEEAQAVWEQVARAGPETQAELAWLRRFVELSAGMVLQAPPPAVRALLARRFAAYAQQQQAPGMLRRLAATLTFDSGGTPIALGMRGISAPEAPRQLIFSTEVADVALNIRPRRNEPTLDVHGQIFPTGDLVLEHATIQLVHDGAEAGITTSDELGEWRLENIAVGNYDLILATADVELVISAVVFRSQT